MVLLWELALGGEELSFLSGWTRTSAPKPLLALLPLPTLVPGVKGHLVGQGGALPLRCLLGGLSGRWSPSTTPIPNLGPASAETGPTPARPK